MLQGPGQINKQNKIADSRRGGGPITPKKTVSAHDMCPYYVDLTQGFRGFGHNRFKAFQGRFQQIFKAANDKTRGRSDRRTL